MDSLTSIIKQKTFAATRRYLPDNVSPISIECREGTSAYIKFSNGAEHFSTCLGCKEQPCMYYSESELNFTLGKLQFPMDVDNRVCVANAIKWDRENNKPIIENDICFLCGACMQRCPAKAIYMKNQQVFVNAEQNTIFLQTQDDAFQGKIEGTFKMFQNLVSGGILAYETDGLLNKAYSRLIKVMRNSTAQFPNHLARNLLISVGINTAMRRRGDVFSRTDLLFFSDDYEGLCEVELLPDVMLDAPRDILDDMAVFISRYDISKEHIIPLIIGAMLPNQRSEYWQVINDIQKVLNVSIRTITIGWLFVLIWNQKQISKLSMQLPFCDVDNCSIRQGIEQILGRPCGFTRTQGLSIFEFAK